MRKYLHMTLIAVAMFFATQVNAQIKFGVKGGLNVTSMSFREDVLDASNRAGFFIGPTVKFTLPIVGLGVDASALYDQRSADVKADGDRTSLMEKTIKQQSINIPVNLRYSIGLGSMANLFVFGGPQWGINVGDEDFKWNETSSYSLKKSNFSVNLGIGATLLSHLQVSANYNIACGKTADIKILGQDADNSKNNSWQIAAAYYF